MREKTYTTIAKHLILFAALTVLPLTHPLAQETTEQPEQSETEEPATTVEDELSPQPELGPRLLSDISEEAQAVRRQQLKESTHPVLPPVPAAMKKQMFDAMSAVSGMSMRELFNFMTSKKKVAEGITFDEVIESMEIKANDVNFKKVGHNMFWRDVGAISGVPTLRVEVLQFCDATVGRAMLDYSPEFVIFIPCRIAVLEDANADLWVMTLDWDVSWLALAWHPDSQLGVELKQEAIRIRDAMEEIMHAGATGEW